MKWLILIGVLLLISVIPLGIRGKYDKNGAFLFLLIGPFSIPLRSGRKKAEKKSSPADSEDQAASESKKRKIGSFSDFMTLAQCVLDLLRDFRKKLRVKNLYLNVILAGEDPCDLAVNYGRTWAALGNFLPLMERFLTIKNRNVQVQCDFEEEQTMVEASIDLTMTLGRLLVMTCFHGVRFMRKYFKIINNAKDGAVS